MKISLGPAQSEAPARQPPGLLAGLLYGGIFLGAAICVCAGVGAMRSFPKVSGIYPKFKYFAERRDDYEVLFVGSSRFYRQIIPLQFDAQVEAATGVKLRSFNFGYDAMWPPESYYVLRGLLKLHPGKLKWVVVEMMDVKYELNEQNTSTSRMAYWHDWAHTDLAVRKIHESPSLDQTGAALAWEHRVHFFKQWIHLGHGAEFLADRLGEKSKRKNWAPSKEWAKTEGFKPGPDTPMSAKDLEHFEHWVARLTADLPKVPPGPVFSEELGKIAAEIRAAGAQPIFVIAPTLNPKENFASVPSGDPLLAFNDPKAYPALFDPAVHYDGWHLNRKGAAIFTEALAQRFAAHLKPSP